jgi:putative membrane protein
MSWWRPEATITDAAAAMGGAAGAGRGVDHAALVSACDLVVRVAGQEVSAAELALGQAIVFVLVALLSLHPRLRMLFVPRAVRTGRAENHAREQFLAHNLHATQSRTGVLIFVSLAEHHAQILADTAIDSHVAEDFWVAIVDRLTAEIAAGRLAEGLVLAVESCGTALAEHFPRRGDDRNELPDKLVEL